MKNRNGITLIALVITIIVMLILVTVTIRVAQDGSLFKHAANAASKTKVAAEGENEISSGNIGGKSIEEIVAEATGNLSDLAKLRKYFIDEDWEVLGEEPIYDLYSSEEVSFERYNGNVYELTKTNGEVTDVNLLVLNGDVLVTVQGDSARKVPAGYIRFTPKAGPAQKWCEWAEDPAFGDINLSLSAVGSSYSDTLKSVIQSIAESDGEEALFSFSRTVQRVTRTFYLNLNDEHVAVGAYIVPNSVYSI